MNVVDRIMALSGSMPNAEAHRHYLEQLPLRVQQARLDDLVESEERFLKRDPYRFVTTQPQPARMNLTHA